MVSSLMALRQSLTPKCLRMNLLKWSHQKLVAGDQWIFVSSILTFWGKMHIRHRQWVVGKTKQGKLSEIHVSVPNVGMLMKRKMWICHLFASSPHSNTFLPFAASVFVPTRPLISFLELSARHNNLSQQINLAISCLISLGNQYKKTRLKFHEIVASISRCFYKYI